MLYTESKQTRGGSDSHIMYDEVLCGNIMSGNHYIPRKQYQLR